jgi:hypothetical protein
VITAIQAIANVGTFSALPNLGRVSYLTQGANSLSAIPSPILTLGTVASVPLTYNAAGQFEPLSRAAGTDFNSAAAGLDSATAASVFNTTNILQGVASDSTGLALSHLLAADPVLAAAAPDATEKSLLTQLASDKIEAAAPLGSTGTTATTTTISSDNTAIIKGVTANGTVAATPAVVASAIPATGAAPATAEAAPALADLKATSNNTTITASSAPTTLAITENVSDTGAVPSALTANFPADAAAQAAANIASNPAYANLAAALYMNAAIYRSQHGSDVAPPNATREPQPVKALRAIYPV